MSDPVIIAAVICAVIGGAILGWFAAQWYMGRYDNEPRPAPWTATPPPPPPPSSERRDV